MSFVFSKLLFIKLFSRYLDNKKQIHAPIVEAKETIITPSTTPNKAPAATVKILGKIGKDKPEKKIYKIKNKTLEM
jgi:hypothetical protein